MFNPDVPAHETQATIEAWRADSFGPLASLPSGLARANEEMAELVKAVTVGADPAQIAEEAADVAITLCGAAERCGTDLTPIMTRRDLSIDPAAVIAIKANSLLAHTMEIVTCERISASTIGIYIDIVVAMMAKLCASLGFNLADEVNDKMAINRARTWRLDGAGHGYHLSLVK
jgi:hypothetical protein